MLRSPTYPQVTPEPGGMATPMAELMQGRPMPVDGLEIGLRPRDLDEIVVGAVEGALAADAEVGAASGDQRLGMRQNEPFGNRCGSARQRLRQVLALVGVEHRESLEERNCIGLVSIALGPPTFLVWREAVGIDDSLALLALADVSAQAKRLAEGEPTLAAEAAVDHRAPENEHIHARVTALGRRVLWHGERSFRRG